MYSAEDGERESRTEVDFWAVLKTGTQLFNGSASSWEADSGSQNNESGESGGEGASGEG